MTSFDVIVVGVGAMGSATCYHLARRGVKVLGLERHGIPHDMGSSHGQSRVIRCAYYEHPDYVPLLLHAWDLWQELGHESGRASLFPTGGFYCGPPGCEYVDASLVAAEEYDLPHERLDRQLIFERFPQFELPDDYSGMYEDMAGFLVPEWCIEDHARLAREHGAVLHEGEAVEDWSTDAAGVTVRTALGTYSADHLVLSAGPWMPSLLKTDFSLQVTRQILGWLRPLEPVPLELGVLPIWAIDCPGTGLLYGFPIADKVDVPGPQGFKVAMHAHGEPADPDTIDRQVQSSDQASFIDRVREWIPAAGTTVDHMCVCMYTNSRDEHFIIDHHPDFERVTIATGFSGHGFKMSSVIGEVLADLATTGRTPHPVGFLGVR
jgi:sarcosine oxidase